MKTIWIKESDGKMVGVEVDEHFYTEWRQLERQNERLRYEDTVHLSYREQLQCAVEKESAEERYFKKIENEQLAGAVRRLTQLQRERLLSYVEGMRITDIAGAEKCSRKAVRQSVDSALRQLRMDLGVKKPAS